MSRQGWARGLLAVPVALGLLTWSLDCWAWGGCVVSRRGCGRVAEGSEQLGGAADDELGDGGQLLGGPAVIADVHGGDDDGGLAVEPAGEGLV